MDNKIFIQNSCEGIVAALNSLCYDEKILNCIDDIVEAIVQSYRKGGRLYIAGNGGSAADAQHLAAEFISKLDRNRGPLPAEALTTDSSIITAIGNDYGFDAIFSRQLVGKIKENDIFLGITTSGMSKNILAALRQCNQLGIKSILLGGGDGGEAKNIATYSLIAPSNVTSTIQELHIFLCHILCYCVEEKIVFMNKS